MSSLVLAGNTSGTVTFQAPDTAGTTVLTLPTVSGTLFATVGGAITIAQGGTGLTSAGAANNLLVSNGTTWTSAALTSSQVTTALGFTPANAAASVASFNTRTGAVTLTSSDVTTALTYTPPQPNGTGASGTWGISISGNAATVSSIAGNSLSSGQVTTALTYTPPQPNGTGASGTWAINVTGNAGTSTSSLSVPINSQTTTYTLVAADTGKCISTTGGGVTIPSSVLAAGNIVTIYNNSGTSQTIAQGGGLTLQWAGQTSSTTGNRTIALYGICTVLFISPTLAVITGSGLT